MIAPEHPQSNGLIEAWNKEIIQRLSKTLLMDGLRHAEWHQNLDQCVYSYNVSPQTVTGVSPHLLFYGREPRLRIDECLDLPRRLLTSGELEKFRKDAVDKLRGRRIPEPPPRPSPYVEGQLVWLRRPHDAKPPKGQIRKFTMRREAPFRIVKLLGDSAAELHDQHGPARGHKQVRRANFDGLDPLLPPPRPGLHHGAAPLIDDTDDEEFEVERIVGHRGFGRSKRYEIKWKGYDKTTWEPPQNLTHCPHLLTTYENSLRPTAHAEHMAERNSSPASSASPPAAPPRRGRGRPRKKKLGELEVGDRVVVHWDLSDGTEHWFQATVSRVNPDGNPAIRYDVGGVEETLTDNDVWKLC